MGNNRPICPRAWRAAAVLSVCLFALPHLAGAQTSGSTADRFYKNGGVEIGVGRSTLAPSGGSTTITPAYGLVAGVFAFVPVLKDALGFEFEVVYAKKGAHVDDGTTANTQHITYLEAPLVGRLTLPGSERARPFLTIGPVFATTIADNVLHATTSFDVGMSAGGGVIAGHFMIAVRYTRGMKATGFVVDGNDLRNRSVAVTLGYLAR